MRNNVWQRSKARGSQPRPVWAIQGLTNRSPWEPTKAFGRVIREAGLTSFMWNLCCKFVKVCNFLSQGVNLRHSGPFRTKLLYLALGPEIFCIFTLGVEAAFDWCLVVCTYWTCWIFSCILNGLLSPAIAGPALCCNFIELPEVPLYTGCPGPRALYPLSALDPPYPAPPPSHRSKNSRKNGQKTLCGSPGALSAACSQATSLTGAAAQMPKPQDTSGKVFVVAQ